MLVKKIIHALTNNYMIKVYNGGLFVSIVSDAFSSKLNTRRVEPHTLQQGCGVLIVPQNAGTTIPIGVSSASLDCHEDIISMQFKINLFGLCKSVCKHTQHGEVFVIFSIRTIKLQNDEDVPKKTIMSPNPNLKDCLLAWH